MDPEEREVSAGTPGSRPALGITDALMGLGVVLGMGIVLGLVAWLHPGRSDRVLRHIVTGGMTLSLLALFLVGWRRIRGGAPFPWPVAAACFVFLAAVAVFVPPFQSSDVYAYGQIGWLQHAYDANPYAVVPADLEAAADDPMFTETWRESPCVYGFLFAHLAHGVAALGDGDPARTLRLFQILGAVVWLAVAALLARALPTTGRPAALYWVLVGPFFVLQGVSNAHNDGLFALFLLVAVLAARRGRPLAVLPALAMATLVKWIAVVAVPFALIHLARRHGAARTLASLGIALLLAGAVSAPYLADVADFDWAGIQAQLSQPSYSLIAALIDTYAWAASGLADTPFSADSVGRALALLALFAYFAFLAVRCLGALRQETYDAAAFTRDVVLAFFVLLFLASAKFFPWYLLMIVPVAALLDDDDPLRRVLFVFTLTWMFVFTGIGKARILDAVVMTLVPLVLVLRYEMRRGGCTRFADAVHSLGNRRA